MMFNRYLSWCHDLVRPRDVKFGVAKFKGLLLAGSFTVVTSSVIRLVDVVLAGRLLGEGALAGVNLAGPVMSVLAFVGGMIASGVATQYSLSMGRCERRRAWQFFMQGAWSVLILGAVIALAILFFGEAFVGFFRTSPEVSRHATTYLSWVWPMAILDGILMLLVSLGYADGDSKLCALGYAVSFCGNVILSTLAVKSGMGTDGLALGSVVSEVLGISVLSVHFFRKSNTFVPVRHFSARDAFRIMRVSFGDMSANLCDGLIFLFLNKLVAMRFGADMLPVIGVAATLWGVLHVLDGIGVAIQPIVNVYFGEGNVKAIRAVMGSAMRWAAGEGLALMALLGLFPSLLVGLLGVSDATLAASSATAVRCLCIGFVPFAIVSLFNSYYMFVEKSAYAILMTGLSFLVLPSACSAGLSCWRFDGVWLGVGLGVWLGVALTLAVAAFCRAKGLPLMLSCAHEDWLHVFDLELNDIEISETSRRVGEIPGVPMRAALMTEEVFQVVKDRNRGRRILGEVTVDLSDGIRLTLRDDGEIFDITDADARISSLRTFLVASMMLESEGRMNLVTTGYNRNVFRF